MLYILQACDAISEAHGYGIVHRDLKPANLFLTRRADGSPLVKVLDFGISKMVDELDDSLTATTDVLGSPLYMSPEQIRNPREVDHRTDIWALGAVLFHLVAGRAAFRGEAVSATLINVVSEPAPSIRAIRPDVPAELEAVILHCLEKDVRARIQHVDDLARALLPFAPGYTPGADTGSVSRQRRRALAEETAGVERSFPGAAFTDRPLAALGRGRVRIVAGAAAVVLVGGGLALLLSRGEAATSPRPQPPPRPQARS